MNRFILLCLLSSLFLLSACREQSKEQILQQGVEFAKAGNQQAAIALFKDALAKDPNYMDARLQLGLAYLELEKLDFAEKELEKVQRQEPANRDISLRLAQIYLSSNRVDKAISDLIRLEAASPEDAEVLVALAQGYAHKGDLAASEDKFRKALLTKPADMNANLGLAQILFATKRVEAGTQLLEKTIADNPDKTTPYYLKFRLAMQQTDRNGAVDALRRIRLINPDDMMAAYILGLLYLDTGDTVAGRKVADEIKSRTPGHPVAFRLEGLASYLDGNYEQAATSLQKSLNGLPDLQGFYFSGITYYQLKQFEQALSSFQKALDLAPDNEQSRLLLAQTFLKQGRVEDGIRAAQTALGNNPQSALAHNILGSAYLMQGKYDQAMLHLDKAIEIDPELAQAHVKKGLFNLSSGNLKRGEADLQKAVATAPEVLNTRLLLANYYLRVQNYPLALKTLQEGLGDSADSAVLYNNMAAAYFGQKKTTEALASLQKAKEIKADYLSPYFNLANYHVSHRDYPAAIKEYQAALKAVPSNQNATLKLAGLYELTGDKVQAEEQFRQASTTGEPAGYLAYAAYLLRNGQQAKSLEVLKAGQAARPNDPNLIMALGTALQATGQFDEAIKLFARLEEIAPRKGSPLLIAAHLQKGNVAAANDIAVRAISASPDSEYGYLLQSAIYEHGKDWSAAEVNLKRGIVACKQDLALRMKLATIYSAQGKSAEALQSYEELLREQPKFVPAIFAKGTLYAAQGNKLKAQEMYQAALALDGDYAPALNNLAYLQMEVHGNYKEALQLAIKAFRLMPEDAGVIDTLGYALLKNGQADNALDFLEKAARLRPNDATIKAHLDQARKAAGKEAG